MRLPIGRRLVKSTYCAVEGYLIFCESVCYLLPLFTQVRGTGILGSMQRQATHKQHQISSMYVMCQRSQACYAALVM
jgi:hypothetical protein